MRLESSNVPSLTEFERMASEAYGNLPAAFRAHCDDLVIRVEDFPDRSVMQAMHLESPFSILGLYHGRGEPYAMVNELPHMPDMIFLYRRPILEYWAQYDEPLFHIVTHVLVHEIGHHFGLSDAAMHALEADAKN